MGPLLLAATAGVGVRSPQRRRGSGGSSSRGVWRGDAPPPLLALAAAAVLLRAAAGLGDDSCWFGGVTYEVCCDKRHGPRGNNGCWDQAFTYERCCAPEAEPLAAPSLECVERDVVLRHQGEHAIFVDVSSHGHQGCFRNDCTNSDKFDAEDWSVCARLCADVEECTHWTFGRQDGATKCFLRKSDGGREKANGWATGAKDCGPKRLPDGYTALRVAECEGLRACDKGKDAENCPDVQKALTTWKLAMKHLKRMAHGRVDEGTMNQIKRISDDCDNAAEALVAEYRPTDKDFGRVVYNNRLVFNTLRDWLASTPRTELSAADASLPNPLRFGTLCGKSSCYEH